MDEYKDYITIGEMAEKLDVSKPRIHQLIDAINAKDETVKSGRVSLISPDLADRIEKRQLAGKEHIVSNADRLKEALQKRIESYTEANNKLTKELTEANETIQTISHENDLLKFDIRRLNDLLELRKNELNSINDKYESLDQKLQQQQLLMMGQIKELSHDNQKILEKSDVERSKGIFSRLFGN